MSEGLKETGACCGYAQYTTTNNAFGLTTTPAAGVAYPGVDPNGSIPRPRAVLLQAEAQNLRWRDDGTNPTNTVGFLLYTGQSMLYDGDLNRIKFIQATSGAILNASYYT